MIDDDNDYDNDWQRRLSRCNVAMEHGCMSLVLIINGKDVEQACTLLVIKNDCDSRPMFLSSTKIPLWVQLTI